MDFGSGFFPILLIEFDQIKQKVVNQHDFKCMYDIDIPYERMYIVQVVSNNFGPQKISKSIIHTLPIYGQTDPKTASTALKIPEIKISS